MAQYKVPQDVEAEDKLLGPFNARQVVYLFVSLGSFALAVALFNFIPAGVALIVAIPLFIVGIFFAILALPLKKDQPTETYLIALVNFAFIKPQKRFFVPGQRESTIQISAPKIIEGPRVRNIGDDEASRRLSFLANIVDSEGRSIKNSSPVAPAPAPYAAPAMTPTPAMAPAYANSAPAAAPMAAYAPVTPTASPVQPTVVAEAVATPDPYASGATYNRLSDRLTDEANASHAAAVAAMRSAINQNNSYLSTSPEPPKIRQNGFLTPTEPVKSAYNLSAPDSYNLYSVTPSAPPTPSPEKLAAMKELSKNTDFSVATIAQQAERINNSDDDEVFVSLH